jgi:hypothetical protein
MKNNDPGRFSRREFFQRTLLAGIGAAAAGGAAYKLYDAKGPNGLEASELVTLKDYSAPVVGGGTMSIVKCADRVKSVNKAIDLLGGIQRFVKPGSGCL